MSHVAMVDPNDYKIRMEEVGSSITLIAHKDGLDVPNVEESDDEGEGNDGRDS
jgi:hypothetical protein